MAKKKLTPPPCLVPILPPNALSINALTPQLVDCAIHHFLLGRYVDERYASFDFCYLYFQQKHGKLSSNMDKSCLQLWSYLASWGMLRNSELLGKSPACLKPLIKYFDTLLPSDWTMDVPNYPSCKDRIYQIYCDIENVLRYQIKMSQKDLCTLITKIMLGVLGCVPAFDRNFRKTFQKLYKGFNKLNRRDLDNIYAFYKHFSSLLHSKKINVIDFNGKQTKYFYTIAKLIDMFGFIVGLYLP